MRRIVSALPVLLVSALCACAGGGAPIASTVPAAPTPSMNAGPALPTPVAAAATHFAEPRAGLRTGGQPSAEDLARLQAQGVRTVIDLRGADEDRGFDQAAEARRLGLEYVALPIAGKDEVNPANAAALKALLHEHGDGVLLHCGSGNRVGALLALGAAGEGMPREQALEFGRQAGMKSLEARVVEQLDALEASPAH